MREIELFITALEEPLPRTDKSWLFMRHRKPEERNYDFRWAIGYRKEGNWWGVIATFPATHEKAIDDIQKEMEYAKKAISLLKKKQELLT